MRNYTRSSARRFIPQCESLGDRILPAVSVSFNPANGQLVLTGNKKNDNIYINDPGNGNLTVNATGPGVFSVAGVKLINIVGKAGKDQVFYTLFGQLTNPLNIKADMGDGNDKFTAEFAGRELMANCAWTINMGANDDKVFLNNIGLMHAGRNFSFRVSGNGNNDTLNASLVANVQGFADFNFTGNQDLDKINFTATNDVDVRPGGRLGFRSDDDTKLFYNGEVDGLLEMYLKGPSNNDVINAQLTIQADSNALVGQFIGSNNGGSGNDTLTFIVTDLSGGFTTVAGLKIIGESGQDKGTFTANVTPSSIEKKNLV